MEAILSQFVRVPISEVVEQRSNALDGSVEHVLIVDFVLKHFSPSKGNTFVNV